MPDLTIQVQEVKGYSGTALCILNGSIDAKTVITFQTHLNSVRGRGINRFILDMENVKYVNSTGLGYLINLSDSVSSEEGAISLVKVQPKVKVVFDMLGLNAFFKIYGTREEALKSLTSAPVATADETSVVDDEPAAAPKQARPAPRTAVAAPPPPRKAPPSSPADAMHVECESCKTLLAVGEIGTYKCPRCLALFNYVGNGKSTFLPRRRAVPVQLSLNFSDECTTGLAEFVRLLARRAGFTDKPSRELQDAVKDTVDTIKKRSYGGNENNVYHVLMHSNESGIVLRFADYGASIPPDEAKSKLFDRTRKIMDRFELKNHPRGGNVLTVSKKAK
ncbi:MAG: anti-sigma factor antagonist [Planctomycetota bacterium]